MIRTKLMLTNNELMNSCWISLQMQMSDFPSYDYEAGKDKDIVVKDKEQANTILGKLKNRSKKQ